MFKLNIKFNLFKKKKQKFASNFKIDESLLIPEKQSSEIKDHHYVPKNYKSIDLVFCNFEELTPFEKIVFAQLRLTN